MDKQVNILIIGSGYVAVWAYRSLVKKLRADIAGGSIKITVVSPYDYHSYHGWTAESLTGIIEKNNTKSSLAEIMPLAEYVKGYAEKLDTASSMLYVRLDSNTVKCIAYDHLLLGFGAYDAESIEGLKQFGFRVKSPEDFDHTFSSIVNVVKWASMVDAETAADLLRFAVAGAGMAGIEIAANLNEYIIALKDYYPRLKDVNHQVTLINSGEDLMCFKPEFKHIKKYVEKNISRSGITVVSKVRVTEITTEGALLSSGAMLPCSMVISTVGQSRFLLKGSEAMRRDAIGRLRTNEFFQIPGQSRVWGGGDACNVPFRESDQPCMADALWAIKHGKYAGLNMARAIKGKPLKPFRYRGMGQAASLGIGKGVGELYGFEFTGMLAWIMRWCFFNYFMPSKAKMWCVMGDWFYLLKTGKRRAFHQAIVAKHRYAPMQDTQWLAAAKVLPWL
jgi:NADH dehydrogenase